MVRRPKLGSKSRQFTRNGLEEFQLERNAHIILISLIVPLMATVSACTHTSPPPSSACAPLSPPVVVAPKPAPPVRPAEQPRVPDEYLVTLAPDVDRHIIFEYYSPFGIKDVFALGGETFLLVLVNDPGPQKMESLIDKEDRIVVVQPNLIYWNNRTGSITK
jgi:hypothetical protein